MHRAAYFQTRRPAHMDSYTSAGRVGMEALRRLTLAMSILDS